MNLFRHVPNALTSANLICGCLGILSVFNYPIESAYFVWAACVFDFFDGFAARMLKVSSPIGKELDSLADVVSFGVLPAMAMYRWIEQNAESGWMQYLAIMIAVFSALRLAKFNIDENQSDSFIGLPTPANALFLTGLVFLPESLRVVVFTGPVLIGITIVFSLLLVSPIHLFALKFQNFNWLGNEIRFTFLAMALLLIVFYQAGALPFIILSYIVISLVSKTLGAQKKITR
jgi:CDP-diacylglycerol--serine O-phosphatidyltransferase